jgi:hypothetical protein
MIVYRLDDHNCRSPHCTSWQMILLFSYLFIRRWEQRDGKYISEDIGIDASNLIYLFTFLIEIRWYHVKVMCDAKH